ncbi:MAG: hypothetical protein DRJ64_02015 [Thermoprotei archaeon]|nr:MAG: hypothetical protein DRJ64_02015 [Thermoprotei archaeon]
MPEKRNLVLITLDSLRADHCSFMGYKRQTTPNLDKFAKDGLYFENAIAPSVGTPTVMFSVFTGEYALIDPRETAPEPWRRAFAKSKTLAQMLSTKGYFTGAFTPNPFVSGYFGFNKGFCYYQDFLSGDANKGVLSRFYNLTEFLARTGMLHFLRNVRNLMLKVMLKEGFFKLWEAYYDAIIDLARRANNPFPFFLWILLIDTHHPYLAPRKFRKWSNFFTMWLSNWRLQKVNWENKLSDRERKWLINAYDDSIYYADSFVKRLWDDLEDLDPVFIIHADHGEGFGEHGLYGHGPFLYEEFIKVPLIIYNADVKGKIDKPVSLLGLAPTILELVGEENEFSPQSFLNEGKNWVISKVLEHARSKEKIAVRMKDYKFITGQKEEDELYYLKKDPHEQKNVISEHPELAKEMRKIVEIHVKQEMEKRTIREIISRIKTVKVDRT